MMQSSKFFKENMQYRKLTSIVFYLTMLISSIGYSNIVYSHEPYLLRSWYYQDEAEAKAMCNIAANAHDSYCGKLNDSGWPVWTYWHGNEYKGLHYYFTEQIDDPDVITEANLGGKVCKNTAKNNAQPITQNPIHFGIENKVLSELDYKGKGVSKLLYMRTYNSKDTAPSQMGVGWRHSYERSLSLSTLTAQGITTSTPYEATIKQGNGRLTAFYKVGNVWETQLETFGKLEEILDLSNLNIGWKLILPNNTEEIFDANGRLLSINYTNGYKITLLYDSSTGHLSTIVDNTGDSLTFAYHSSGNVKSIKDGQNRTWGYRYGANNNLEYVDNPDGTTKKYHYENANYPTYVTGITDERNKRYSTYQYDSQGRAYISSLANNVEKVTVSYINNTTRTITNSKGIETTYNLQNNLWESLIRDISGPGCTACGSGNTSYTYDEKNNVTSRTKDNVTTTYGNYDSKGNYGYMIEADGTPKARRTDFTYDQRFQSKVLTKTEPSVYATGSKVTTYTYDDFGNVTSITISGHEPNGAVINRVTTLQYNGPLKQLTKIDGPITGSGDATILDYYSNNPSEGNNRARLKSIVAANGSLLRSSIQYSASGKVLSETRLNGMNLNYTYYPGNNRLESLTESSSTGNRTTYWTYLATGEVNTVTQAYGTSQAATITLDYDDARRLTKITDTLGNYVEYILDTESNSESEKVVDNNGVLLKTINQAFDAYNKLDSVTLGNESIDYTFSPEGTLKQVTNGNQSVTSYSYDELKRLSSVIGDVGSSDLSTADTVTKYVYNVHGQIITVTSPNGASTGFVYDDLGNLLSESSSDRGITNYTYDVSGNIKSKTDARNIVTSYGYDSLNRIIAIDLPGTEEDIRYVYDTDSGCTNGVSRLCRIEDQDGITKYSYDAFGNTVKMSKTILGQAYVTTYDYDILDRLKSVTLPSGRRVNYALNIIGQVKAVATTLNGTAQNILNNVDYRGDGQLASIEYGNNLKLVHSFNAGNSRLESQSLNNQINDLISLSSYAYDNVGNVNLLTRDNVNNEYFYDSLSRLINLDSIIIDTSSGQVSKVFSAWNPNMKGSAVTVHDDNNVTITNYGSILANQPILSGKWYWEVTVGSGVDHLIGVGNASMNINHYPGVDVNGWGWYTYGQLFNGGVIDTAVKYASGDVLGLALDMDSGTLRLFKNGVEVGQFSGLSGSVYPAVGNGAGGGDHTTTTNFGASPFIYSPPGGYHAGKYTFPVQINSIGSVAFNYDRNGNRLSKSLNSAVETYVYDELSNRLSNPANGQSSKTYATWNSNTKGSAVNVNSINNVTITSYGSILANLPISSGKWYWEVTVGSGVDHLIGVGNASMNINHYPGVDVNGWGWYTYGQLFNGGVIGSAVSYTAGDVLGLALDMDSGTLRLFKNGVEVGQFTGLSGSVYPAVGSGAGSGSHTTIANFGASPFTHVPPAGYSAGVYVSDSGNNKNVIAIDRDVAGNRISDRDGTRVFNYNKAGRLYQVLEHGQVVATYIYNALGQRTRKQTANGLVIYHYNLNGKLISENDGDGNIIREYIWRNNQPVAQITIAGGVEQIGYLHNDHLGTPQTITDQNGTIIWRASYSPFGNAAVNEDVDNDGSSITLNLRFPGQYYDGETGLHYNYFRYYDPKTGRYITSDPIGLQGGLNTYGYVGGNPTKYSDAYGLDFAFSVDPLAAGGNGHTTLYFQDGPGQWYSYNQGAAGAVSSGGNYGFLTGLDAAGGVGISPVVVPPPSATFFPSSNAEDIKIQSCAIDSQKDHASGKLEYNLYSNNCTDAGVDVLSCAGISVGNPVFTIRPNSWITGLSSSKPKRCTLSKRGIRCK